MDDTSETNDWTRPDKKVVAAKKAKVEKATSKPKSAVEARPVCR